MSSFLDLAGDDDGSTAVAVPVAAAPAAPKKSFLALAGSAPKGKAAVVPDAPTNASFQTNNPAATRARLVALNQPAVLAEFDRQFPQVTNPPAPAPVAPPAPPATNAMDVARQIPGNANIQPQPAAPAETWWQKFQGASQAVQSTLAAPVATVMGDVAGAAHFATGGNYNAAGLHEAGDYAEGAKQRAMDLLVGQTTPTAQRYTQNISDAINDTGLNGVAPLSEVSGAGAATNSAGRAAADVVRSKAQTALQSSFQDIKANAARVEPTLGAVDKPRFKLVDGKPQAVGAPATPAVAPSPAPVTTSNIPQAQPAAVVPPTAPVAAPVTAQSAAQARSTPLPRMTLNPMAPPEQAFADVPPNGATALPAAIQQQRAQILQSVGLDTARKSSLAGDGLGASTDAQTAKLDSPSGNAMKLQLDNERNTLNNYADTLVRNTGGTTALDQTADYTRGSNITAALDGIKDWYDGHISTLYKAADERAQGVPTELDSFRTVLGDDSEMTHSDRVHLRGAIQSYAQKLNIIHPDGSIFADAQQAETMRKFLGKNWSPQNSGFVGALKDALDDDVTKSAGEDVYAAARQMRADRGRTLDNPNGIAKIMDSSGPNGINRTVATEKIPTAIGSMPVDQLRHVVDTLKNSPPEVQAQSQAALSEIKSHFASQVRAIGGAQAGQFNAKGVGNYLRSNAARMNIVFTPEEMEGFQNLHQAGQILAKDQSYPGAAAQGHNLLRSGVMAGVQGGATAVGAAVGGPVGAAAGSFVGGKAAQAIGERASLGAVRKRMTRLSEFPQ